VIFRLATRCAQVIHRAEKSGNPVKHRRNYGAGNEARTRDLNLGKVALYQLSYSRLNRGAIVGPYRRESSKTRCEMSLRL
jgi:hypothetical protein